MAFPDAFKNAKKKVGKGKAAKGKAPKGKPEAKGEPEGKGFPFPGKDEEEE